jgi:hypothetical protein
MDTVADYWGGVDTELKFIDDQAKKLQDDSRLRVKIKSLQGYWEGIARDHKRYISAVRAILHEHVRYLLFSAQHAPEQQSTIQVIGIFKSRDNSAQGRRKWVTDDSASGRRTWVRGDST